MMAKKLKVYGWIGMRRECPGHHHQTHEICAAPSMAAVARVMGVKSPRQLFNLSETGNKEDIAKALSEPYVVFWRPLDQLPRDRCWSRDEGTKSR
jgi:hypothetical protein